MGRKLEELRPKIGIAPTVGLEPATARSGALPSADRARWAVIFECQLEICSEHHRAAIFANCHVAAEDILAERPRRRPGKPMGFPRVGSNPTGVAIACLWLLSTAFF